VPHYGFKVPGMSELLTSAPLSVISTTRWDDGFISMGL
jgi:hypothetical protein